MYISDNKKQSAIPDDIFDEYQGFFDAMTRYGEKEQNMMLMFLRTELISQRVKEIENSKQRIEFLENTVKELGG